MSDRDGRGSPRGGTNSGWLVIGAVIVGVLLAGGGVLGAVALSGRDDPGPSEETAAADDMLGRESGDAPSVDSASGSEIVQSLENAGYACGDSLVEPEVRRCFATRTRPSSSSQSGPVDVDLTVGLQTNNRDEVERFKVAARSKLYAGPLTDHEQLTAAARAAWQLVAPPLIGHADAATLADKLGGETMTRAGSARRTATFISSDQATVSVDVLADGVVPTQYQPQGLDRSLSEFQSSLEGHGFHCLGPTICQRDAFAMQLPLEDPQLGLLGFSIDTYPHTDPRVTTMRVNEAVLVLEHVVADAGLDSEKVRALISDGFAEGRSTVTADIDGVNYSLSTWVDAGSVDLMRLEVLVIEW